MKGKSGKLNTQAHRLKRLVVYKGTDRDVKMMKQEDEKEEKY